MPDINFIAEILKWPRIIGSLFAFLCMLGIAWYTLRGLFPALFRLGHGLWRRKIAVVAEGDTLSNLETLIKDSRLFNKKNIIRVAGSGEYEAISRASVILVYWADAAATIDDVLAHKREDTALIIYAPYKDGPIPIDVMEKLETRKHVVVNNFRGRLMNDIVTSMITTGYAKKSS